MESLRSGLASRDDLELEGVEDLDLLDFSLCLDFFSFLSLSLFFLSLERPLSLDFPALDLCLWRLVSEDYWLEDLWRAGESALSDEYLDESDPDLPRDLLLLRSRISLPIAL